MPNITDADLEQLTTRRSLLERAKEAQRERLRAQKEENEREYANLCNDAYFLMRDVLGMTEGEISEVEFKRSMYNAERQKVQFEVEDFVFFVRYKLQPIKIGKSDSTQEVVGYDFVPVYEYRPKKMSSWQEFTELADIAKPFGVTI